MQRGYRCVLIEPTGERFDPCFVPDLTPSGSSRSRLRRQAHDRLPRRISPAPSCALDRLRETSRSSAPGAGVIVSHDERGNIAITPSPSLAGIITELGTSRLL
jgi:hypothetical protein